MALVKSNYLWDTISGISTITTKMELKTESTSGLSMMPSRFVFKPLKMTTIKWRKESNGTGK